MKQPGRFLFCCPAAVFRRVDSYEACSCTGLGAAFSWVRSVTNSVECDSFLGATASIRAPLIFSILLSWVTFKPNMSFT